MFEAPRIDGRERWRSLLCAAYFASAAAATGVYFTLSSVPRAVLYDGIGLSAALAVLVGVRLHRPRRPAPWFFLAGGLTLFALGDVVWDVLVLGFGNEDPFPSLADVLYLASYPLFAAGLFLMLGPLRSRRQRGVVLDVLIVACAFSLPIWVLLIEPYAGDAGSSLMERAVLIAYPIADVVLVGVLAHMLFSPGGRTLAFRALVAGALVLLAADLVYSVTADAYAAGDITDAGWLLFAVCWGSAALHPSMRSLIRSHPRRRSDVTPTRLALICAAILVPPAVLLAQHLNGEAIDAVAIGAGGAAVAALALARIVQLVRHSERLRLTAEALQKQHAVDNERLRELDRMKDSFVASVSHELRTPLTAIRGYLDLVREGRAGELTAGQEECLEIVDRNATRLIRVVNDLLSVAEAEAGTMAFVAGDVELWRVAEDAVAAARPLAEERQIAVRLTGTRPPRFVGDSARLSQLLDNLISNALKFTPEGGRVDVRVALAEGAALLEVADTGMGIPPEEQDRLFQRFFRTSAATSRAIQGTGLGLTIARAIAEGHGGSIDFESEEGVGTTFRVRLPLARAGMGVLTPAA